MTFQSGVTAVGGRPYYLLTYVVAIVLVACVSAFVSVLGLEVWRSVRFARKLKHVKRQATASASESATASTRRSHADHSLPQSLAADHVQLHGSDGTSTASESRWMTNPMKRRVAPPPCSPEIEACASAESGVSPTRSPTSAARAAGASATAASSVIVAKGGDDASSSDSVRLPVLLLSRQLRATATTGGLRTFVPGRESSQDSSHRFKRVRQLSAIQTPSTTVKQPLETGDQVGEQSS